MLRRIRRIVERSEVLLFTTALGGVLTFAVVFRGQTDATISHLQGSRLGDAIVSGALYKGSSLVALAFATPLYLDIAFDWANVAVSWLWNRKRGGGGKKKGVDATINLMSAGERFLLISAIILNPIVAFLPNLNATPNVALIYWAATRAQTFMVAGTVACSLSRYNRVFFPAAATFLFLVLFAIGNAVAPLATNAQMDGGSYYTTTNAVQLVFTWVPAVAYVLLILRWLVVVPFELSKFVDGESWLLRMLARISDCLDPESDARADSPRSPRSPRDGAGAGAGGGGSMLSSASAALSFRSIYVLTIVIWLSLRLASSYTYARAADYDDTGLLFINVPFVLLELSTLVFDLRFVKHEVVQGLMALIDAKKNYVRYIR